MFKSRPIMYVLFIPILFFFIVFLILPIAMMGLESFKDGNALSIANYLDAFRNQEIKTSMIHSVTVSFVAACMTTAIAFIIAYTFHMIQLPSWMKQIFKIGVLTPMLLPTITYGFVIMYAFGNQGFLTKLFGEMPFSIYGFNGLLIGYVLYTLPTAFLLIYNGFQYVDQRYVLVSRLMGDSFYRRFYHAVFRPLMSPIGGAFVLSFVLSFTDFGIPASIGGEYEVIAMTLYQTMLGAIPKFEQGAVIAVIMLIPAIIGVVLLSSLEKFNVQSEHSHMSGTLEKRWQDVLFALFSTFVVASIFFIFIVMFIAPFTIAYPYNMRFTLEHVATALTGNELIMVYKNSLIVALSTAVIGTAIAFISALVSTRTAIKFKKSLNWMAMITNTVPGMVLGLSYLFLFNGSSLKGTFAIIVISNIVHFFTTPYLMAKNALERMNTHWEVIGELLRDSWMRTIWRVIIPNMKKTMVEMFSFYFIHAMVTISGVIFLVTTTTSLVATKINELQHFNKFNEIFLLSILIFLTNLLMKLISEYVSRNHQRKKHGKRGDVQ